MKRRGRPPHPDILTPREWEVHGLLRERLSNPEMAERLGVTRDAVKYHVSQILRKLGVSTREEAAAWQADPAETGNVPRTPPTYARAGKFGLFGAAGLALAGLGALAGGVIYTAVGGGNDDTGDAQTAADAAEQVLLLGEVAYVRDGNLWTLDLDTGEEALVAEGEPYETLGTSPIVPAIHSPEWSADGEWIAFGLDLGPDYVRSMKAANVRTGAVHDLNCWGGDYGEWAPTGHRIATGTGVAIVSPGEIVASPAGVTPMVTLGADCTLVTNAGIAGLIWDPSERYVVTSHAAGSWSGDRDDYPEGPYSLVLVDIEAAQPTYAPGDAATGVTTLFDGGNADGPPLVHSWSPDGSHILFWSVSGPDVLASELISLSVESGEVGRIPAAALVPNVADWSPDGTAIAVVTSDGPAAWMGTDLRVFKPDGTQVASPTEDNTIGLEPDWSPDSARIAFASELEDGPGGNLSTLNDTAIWVANADGSNPVQLTTGDTYADRYPQFSRDGSHILFVRLDARTIADGGSPPAELWLMRADGSDQRKVADLPAVDLASSFGYVDWPQYMDWYQPEAPAPTSTGEAPINGIPTLPPLATQTLASSSPELPLQIGDGIDLPPNMALLVQAGCWQCDGGGVAPLYRVYQDPRGDYVAELLLDGPRLREMIGPRPAVDFNGAQIEADPYVTSGAFDQDGSEIIIAVCTWGTCEGNYGPSSTDAEARLYRSTDGGVTWSEFGEIGAEEWVIGLTPDGVITWRRLYQVPDYVAPAFRSLPDGGEMSPPVEGAWPVTTSAGREILWVAEGAVYTADGRLFATLPGLKAGAGLKALGDMKVGIVFSWLAGDRPQEMSLAKYTVLSDGSSRQDWVSQGGRVWYAGAWLPKDGLIVADVMLEGDAGLTPALIDAVTGAVSPIINPFRADLWPRPDGNNFVFAIQTGPFARVINTGSCLNVRAEPGAASQALECAADGVLLRPQGESAGVEGEGVWIRVLTPAGVGGWVSAEYLDIVGVS